MMEEKRLPIGESREQGYNHGATGPKMDKESEAPYNTGFTCL